MEKVYYVRIRFIIDERKKEKDSETLSYLITEGSKVSTSLLDLRLEFILSFLRGDDLLDMSHDVDAKVTVGIIRTKWKSNFSTWTHFRSSTQFRQFLKRQVRIQQIEGWHKRSVIDLPIGSPDLSGHS